jgi:hypothetical protein
MGVIFSKIEKFFDKKYRYNVYNSIVKNDVDVEEEDCLIYDNDNNDYNDNKKTRIDYYNKKLEGIMYL